MVVNMKNKKNLLLAFVIPFLIYFAIFYMYGFFTSKLIIFGDSAGQYFPLFNYLKDLLDGISSLFYSFSKGLSGPMFGTFFYYLSSPFNLLISLIDKANIVNFMTLLIIIKLSLCSLTMYIYLSKKFKNNSLTVLIFSLLYSFLGYNLNYFFNIMWLDIVLLSPLVLLGIDNIIENKSPFIYILFLTTSIISNYYIAYMLCIFAVIYFIYELLLKYNFKDNKQIIKKISLKFIISSLLCGMMCSFFLIPCIIEMLSYGRGLNLKQIFTIDYNIFNLLAGTYINAIDVTHPFNTYYFNLYCGIITLPLVFLYLRNKDVSKREKKLIISVIIFMILPCFFGLFNWFWHLFSTPFGYYYRYSFLLCLFLIRIAYQSFKNLKCSITDLLSYLAIYLAYSVIMLFIINFKNYYSSLNYLSIWLTVIILIIYSILIYRRKSNKIIFTIMIIELIIYPVLAFNNSDFSKRDKLPDYKEIVDKYNDNRIALNTNSITGNFNDSLIYNYNGTSVFLSTINNDSINMHYKLGMNSMPISTGINNYIGNNHMNYIENSLLGVKTVISTTDDLKYDLIEKNNDLFIYNNPNALSIGYMVKNSCNNLDISFPYDEQILNCLTGENISYYKKYKPINNTYKIDKGYYYIYMENIEENYKYFANKLQDNIKLYNKNFIFAANDIDEYILDLSDFNNKIKIYSFDYESFQKSIEILKKEQLEYTLTKDTLTGNIDTKGGLLLITIPLDNGTQVYVDNELIKPKLVLDSLIGIDLESGQHSIKITYKQPGLKIGISISIISLFISIIYILYQKKIQ